MKTSNADTMTYYHARANGEILTTDHEIDPETDPQWQEEGDRQLVAANCPCPGLAAQMREVFVFMSVRTQLFKELG